MSDKKLPYKSEIPDAATNLILGVIHKLVNQGDIPTGIAEDCLALVEDMQNSEEGYIEITTMQSLRAFSAIVSLISDLIREKEEEK